MQQATDWYNPLKTDGFAWLEYTVPSEAEKKSLGALFESMGFAHVGQHKTRDISWYQQGDIIFLINLNASKIATSFATIHGASVSGMAFKVHNAAEALDFATTKGALKLPASEIGWCPLHAVYGIGESGLYFVDNIAEQEMRQLFDLKAFDRQGAGLLVLDHVTHNVPRGNMDKWSKFYEDIANFKEVRYFDIEGKLTGLLSRAMTAPCGKIRIPINESTDDQSQIEEFLREYKGEGIQHIALTTNDIYQTVDQLKAVGLKFLDTPDTYYDRLDARVPEHGESVEALRTRRILLDGAPIEGDGILLQIFTENAIGPVFFEIIQRKGNEGFGEGNFQALFESIEADQLKRGVIK